MKFFSQKRNVPLVELTHFWIVEITQVKHLTCLYIPCLLAFETSKMYTTAADSLATLDQKVFGHWRQYFVLKTKFYQAYVSKDFFRWGLHFALWVDLTNVFPMRGWVILAKKPKDGRTDWWNMLLVGIGKS
jgi:hypothetical protein